MSPLDSSILAQILNRSMNQAGQFGRKSSDAFRGQTMAHGAASQPGLAGLITQASQNAPRNWVPQSGYSGLVPGAAPGAAGALPPGLFAPVGLGAANPAALPFSLTPEMFGMGAGRGSPYQGQQVPGRQDIPADVRAQLAAMAAGTAVRGSGRNSTPLPPPPPPPKDEPPRD